MIGIHKYIRKKVQSPYRRGTRERESDK
jgi:hypothetical protein